VKSALYVEEMCGTERVADSYPADRERREGGSAAREKGCEVHPGAGGGKRKVSPFGSPPLSGFEQETEVEPRDAAFVTNEGGVLF